MKIAFAELMRDRVGRLQIHTGGKTSVFKEMARLLEDRFQAKAFVGSEGILRLEQEYQYLRRDCGNFVIKHSRVNTPRLAVSQPIHQSEGQGVHASQCRGLDL